jgi:hypothetical protein
MILKYILMIILFYTNICIINIFAHFLLDMYANDGEYVAKDILAMLGNSM